MLLKGLCKHCAKQETWSENSEWDFSDCEWESVLGRLTFSCYKPIKVTLVRVLFFAGSKTSSSGKHALLVCCSLVVS